MPNKKLRHCKKQYIRTSLTGKLTPDDLKLIFSKLPSPTTGVIKVGGTDANGNEVPEVPVQDGLDVNVGWMRTIYLHYTVFATDAEKENPPFHIFMEWTVEWEWAKELRQQKYVDMPGRVHHIGVRPAPLGIEPQTVLDSSNGVQDAGIRPHMINAHDHT